MPTELMTPGPEHAPELARLFHEAFCALQDRHATPRDIDSLETARHVIEWFIGRVDGFRVAAVVDGRLAGGNFLDMDDPVAGLGPVFVDPAVQAKGLGRRLMQAAIDHALDRGVQSIRLFQEAINTTSLSLYTSLGFDWRDSAAVMEAKSAAEDDASVRAMTLDDLGIAEDLSKRHFRTSRRNGVAAALRAGMPAFVRERSGKAAGYFLPGFVGHGAAESVDDALALIVQAARRSPAGDTRFFCPLSQPDLFRRCLAAGCRTLKVMSYMSYGPYDPPREVWMPSILR